MWHARVVCYIVDVQPIDESDPVANAQIILNELNKFSQELSQLPQILVLNKIDQIPNEQRDAVCQDIITRLGWAGEVFYTSTLTGEGLKQSNII